MHSMSVSIRNLKYVFFQYFWCSEKGQGARLGAGVGRGRGAGRMVKVRWRCSIFKSGSGCSPLRRPSSETIENICEASKYFLLCMLP